MLGHRRLSIVDLHSGSQPMWDAAHRHCVVFNGEIYGFRDLREHLDYPFRTESDTEVLLALYDRYGEAMLSHLPGMFAFALWDEPRRQLFAARDRFGEKPLYYSVTPAGDLVFASEIKALVACGLVRPRLDRQSLAHYLNRLYVPVGRSIFSTIQQLRPGHALSFGSQGLTTWRYWEPPSSGERLGLGEAAEEFRRLMVRAVGRQLVADVEVGAFLSGGLDSSTVVSLAAGATSGLRTFSFGFSDGPSELGYATEVAARYGTRHVELRDSQDRVADVLVSLARVYDEPFGDSSAVPTFMLSRLASRELKVVLTGDGADELLAGYPWYRDVWYEGRLSAKPAWEKELLYFLLRAARRALAPGNAGLHRRLRAFNRHRAGQAPSETHRELTAFVKAQELREAGLDPPAHEDVPGADAVDQALRTDLLGYMAGDILVKTDRASMAHGLELRAPFLDVDVASFCLSLPSRLKIDGRSDKILLRKAFAERWPASVKGRAKQGFAAPVTAWLGRPEFRELAQAYLEAPAARQALDELVGESLRSRLASERSDRTWALLALSIWRQVTAVEA